MKFILSLFTLLAVQTEGFVTKPFTRTASSSSLRMVADDAKVILVTGSSRGLGKAVALEMGKAGQKVIVNYVSDGSKEAADQTVSEIKELGGDAVAIQADSKYIFIYIYSAFHSTTPPPQYLKYIHSHTFYSFQA